MDSDTHLRQCEETFRADNPFLTLMGVSVTSFSTGSLRLDLDVRHDHTNIYGIAHGAVGMTLADTAMGGACLTVGKRVVTLDMNLSFLRAIPEGEHIYATGEIIHSGISTMVCEGKVYDSSGELCMKATGTFFIIRDIKEETAQ